MTPAEWFHNHGVGVFPLIRRTKQPKVSFPTYTCTSAQAAQFRDYGVRHIEIPATSERVWRAMRAGKANE